MSSEPLEAETYDLNTGHHIKDCPTNSDRSFGTIPSPTYVCHNCGATGQHYILDCPSAQRPKREKRRFGDQEVAVSSNAYKQPGWSDSVKNSEGRDSTKWQFEQRSADDVRLSPQDSARKSGSPKSWRHDANQSSASDLALQHPAEKMILDDGTKRNDCNYLDAQNRQGRLSP